MVELFQLWDLEQRQSSRKVAEKHTLLLAAVLRCVRGTAHAQGPTAPGTLLARRLLHERATELHAQLISSNQGLATATLRLLKALVRLGPGPAWEVVARFSLTAKPVLHLFAPSSPLSRPPAVALAAALVRCPDPAMAVRLLSTDRVLKAVFRSLLADRARTAEAWLAALACALAHPRVPAKSKRRLVTSYRLEQLRRLLLPGGGGGGGGEGGQQHPHHHHQQQHRGPAAGRRGPPVRRELVCRLIHALLGSGGGGGGGGNAPQQQRVKGARGVMAVVRLLLALGGSDDAGQQQLALEILGGHPEVGAPFMRRFNQTWEARPSFTGLSSYLFLARLLRADPPAAAALLALEGDEAGQGQSQQQQQQHQPHRRRAGGPDGGGAAAAAGQGEVSGALAMERVLGGLLPSGLGKRELTKAILGQSPFLQRMGLLLLAHALKRAETAIAQAAPATARALRLALPHRLPDLQAVLAVRSRCHPSTGGGGAVPPPPAWGNQMLALVLRVLRAYQEVAPEAMQAFRFDFLRLLPDAPGSDAGHGASGGGLAALPGFVQWELLRLLEALGPKRLQWLPPDAQGWISSGSGSSSGGNAGTSSTFQQMLALLGATRDRRLYALARRLLLGVIQSKVGGADAADLGDALLDAWDGSADAAALLECALRLAANRPYPFSLMVLRLLPAASASPAPPSPVLVALLLLVTSRAFTPAEEEALRGELHVFGLGWDALKGRFAASPAALSYARAVLRAQRAAAPAEGAVDGLDACVRLLLLDAPAPAAEEDKGSKKGKRGKAASKEAGDAAEAGLRAALARYREASGSSSSSVESALWAVEQALARVPLGRLLQGEQQLPLLHEVVAGLGGAGSSGAGRLTLAGYLRRHGATATAVASVFDALAGIKGKGGEETLALLPRALPLPVLLAHHAAATTAKGRHAGDGVLSQHLRQCTTAEALRGACLALLTAAQEQPASTEALQSSLLRILAQGAVRWALRGGPSEALTRELQQSLGASGCWMTHPWLGAAALLCALVPAPEGQQQQGQQGQQDTRRALGWGLLFQQAPSGALLRRLCADSLEEEEGQGDGGGALLLRVCLRELLVTAPAVVEGLDVDARLRVASSLLLAGGKEEREGAAAAAATDMGSGIAGLLLRLAAPEGGAAAASIVPELAARGELVSRCWAGLCADGPAEAAEAFALLLGRCVQEVEAARGFVLERLVRWVEGPAGSSRRPGPLFLAPALAVLAARPPADGAQRGVLLQCTGALGDAVLSAPSASTPVDVDGESRLRLEAWTLTALRRLLQMLADGEQAEELLPVVERWQELLSAALGKGEKMHVSLATALACWMAGPSSPLPAVERGRAAGELVVGACGALGRVAPEMEEDEQDNAEIGALAAPWLGCLRQLSSDPHAGPRLQEALAAEQLGGSKKKKKEEKKDGQQPLTATLRGLSLAAAQHLGWTPLVAATTELLACMLPPADSSDGEQWRHQPLVGAALEGLHEEEQGQARLLRALQGEEASREAVLRLLLLLVSRLGPDESKGMEAEEEENGEKATSAVAEHGRRLAPALLATYRASMAPTDLLTLRLLWALSAGGLRLGLAWFRLGAPAAEVDHAMAHGHFPNRMDGCGADGARGGAEAAAWLLEWVDPERVFASLEAFPLHRPLFPPPIEPWEGPASSDEAEAEAEEEEEEEANEDAPAHWAAPSAASVYDPSFLLPLLEGLLRHQSVSVRALVDSCLLSYCLVALASARRAVRACAYSCLHSALQLLERAPKNDPGAFFSSCVHSYSSCPTQTQPSTHTPHSRQGAAAAPPPPRRRAGFRPRGLQPPPLHARALRRARRHRALPPRQRPVRGAQRLPRPAAGAGP